MYTNFHKKIIHRDSFLSIKRNLHFSNEKKKKNDNIFKINKIQLYLKTKFNTNIDPERDLSLDESLMLFKGRLGWKQYLPLKRSRLGIKIYIICESNSGYVWDFIIYTGHGTKYNKIYNKLSVTSQVVMKLVHPLLNKGHCIIMGNYYNSPQLSQILLKNGTDSYGTLNPRRKDLPKIFDTNKLKRRKNIIQIWKNNVSIVV